MASSTRRPTRTPTQTIAESTSVPNNLNFQTPVLTTTFTPPPSCTQSRLTMLEADQFKIWLNAPLPVPNTPFSDCYPSQFMTSYLDSVSSTFLPAFSPLVCPDNYFTIFSQTFTSRPLYIACCPRGYGLAPPRPSTPGRPAYGGTCYSDIKSVTVTLYNNSTSSGVQVFSTPGQAYAHPIDGFALETASSRRSPGLSDSQPTSTSDPLAAAAASSSAPPAASSSSSTNTGLIAGLAIGLGVGVGLLLAASFFFVRARKRKARKAAAARSDLTYGQDAPWPTKNAKELPSPPIPGAPGPPGPPMRFRSELSDGPEANAHEMPVQYDASREPNPYEASMAPTPYKAPMELEGSVKRPYQ